MLIYMGRGGLHMKIVPADFPDEEVRKAFLTFHFLCVFCATCSNLPENFCLL